MQLYLIRHAQSQNNALPQEQRVEDPPITDIGCQQARHLAEWIGELQLTRLITSPFLRTLQTAEYIRQATGLTPEVQVDLHELGGCVSGPAPEVMVGRPGMTQGEIESQFSDFMFKDQIDGHGWWKSKPYESEHLARRRAESLLTRTRGEFTEPEERVAYLMHADFKLVFLSHFHPDPLECPYNTSVTRCTVTTQTARLELFNQVEHLPADLITR